jgi:endo-1,4-beta-D-glucanase Y
MARARSTTSFRLWSTAFAVWIAVAACASGEIDPSDLSGASGTPAATSSGATGVNGANGAVSTGANGASSSGAVGTGGGSSAAASGSGGATGAASTTTGAGGAASTTTGTGGATGATSTGAGGTGMGPTPPSATAQFPFPQNRKSERCTYPNYSNATVLAQYTRWKNTAVTSSGADGNLRVAEFQEDRPAANSDTFSEGVAYGMLAAVYMDDQPTFDALWKYSQARRNGNGFMHWKIGPSGNVLEMNGATDADEDMAWALLMAEEQWGGSGSVGTTYGQLARDLIGHIWDHEVDHGGGNVLKPGDMFGGANETNPSYFAPAYYRVFAQVTGQSGWNSVVDSSYNVLNAAANGSTGLVPAWCSSGGGATRGGQEATYQFDACRVPWRIAMDYCWNGETRAKAYLDRVSAFFSGQGAANIWDGYNLDGSPSSFSGSKENMAFIGTAGVGATATTNATFVQQTYDQLLVLGNRSDFAYRYYAASMGMLSMLFFSGQLIDYTKY